MMKRLNTLLPSPCLLLPRILPPCLLPPRALAPYVLASIIALGLLLGSLMLGSQGLSKEALGHLIQGNATPFEQWQAFTLRLPRAFVALCAGFALGVSGALFQGITRNPLGSPDIIGLTASASLGALLASSWLVGIVSTTTGAALGAIIGTLAVYSGSGRGFRHPSSMIIAGIAINALALAGVQLNLTWLGQEQARDAMIWLSGSVAGRQWHDLWPMLGLCLLLLPGIVLIAPQLRLMALGDPVAKSLGVNLAASRLLSALMGAFLAGGAVATVGPIAFVSLAAPQLALRLWRKPGPLPLAAGVVGALLLLAADLAAQYSLPSGALPVGVLTAGLGGIYLVYLLNRQRRG
ncbi:FecCD family ABC transporter permease [Vreelandella alkaliphila]|uniref:Iron chelate uptake ABC transporter family permease subunit n=1 Tax=Vreelandella alkaliphila TaxID=272774 RepID=A0AAJ2S0W2_9GAMM|nr:iron chelate uptake ABC transporter family permease subunit [Halomonas alkaliphila]MDX5977768.1 iron chelate uptake ABC transporter family permease subunit [Halomonas alkaliphila]